MKEYVSWGGRVWDPDTKPEDRNSTTASYELINWKRIGFAKIVDDEYWSAPLAQERDALRTYRDEGWYPDDLALTVDGVVVEEPPTACDGIDWDGSDEGLANDEDDEDPNGDSALRGEDLFSRAADPAWSIAPEVQLSAEPSRVDLRCARAACPGRFSEEEFRAAFADRINEYLGGNE